MKLKQGDLEAISTDDFWYDLTLGGYIKPKNYLNEESAEKVKTAIKVIQEFQDLLEENGLLEDM